MLMSIIYLLLVFIPLYFFVLKKKQDNENEISKKDKKKKQENKKEINDSQKTSLENSRSTSTINNKEENDSKKAIINSFRDGKTISNYYFSPNGDYIVYHDEKKFCLILLTDPLDRDLKKYSKSIDRDVISHVNFAFDTKIMAVGLKNSKELIFYSLEKQEDTGKLKFVKIEKIIGTQRKYDIQNVAITNDGNYVATSGSGQDTTIQIYSYMTGKIIGNIDINAIQNFQMKLSPDNKYITISNYMYEISVIAINENTHHIKNSSQEEINVSVSIKYANFIS